MQRRRYKEELKRIDQNEKVNLKNALDAMERAVGR